MQCNSQLANAVYGKEKLTSHSVIDQKSYQKKEFYVNKMKKDPAFNLHFPSLTKRPILGLGTNFNTPLTKLPILGLSTNLNTPLLLG